MENGNHGADEDESIVKANNLFNNDTYLQVTETRLFITIAL